MSEWKATLFCACANFRKWRSNANILVIAAIMLMFALWNNNWINQFCAATGSRVSIWVFPFFFVLPSMTVVLGCLTVLLFCNAPFYDAHTPFVMIRTGKRAWINGQILYIPLASFIYTLFYWVSALLVLLPHLGFSTEWGTVIETLANTDAAAKLGIEESGTLFSPRITNTFSAAGATALSFVLCWLVSSFLGMLILAFHVVVGKNTGIIAAGVFIALGYLVYYVGEIHFGPWLYYLSPVVWANLNAFDLLGEGLGRPPLAYAIAALVFAITLLSVIASTVFCSKDTSIQKGE